MSAILPCQDLSFVGGRRYNCPYTAPASAEPTVDVSTETLDSLWDAQPRDNGVCQQHAPPLNGLRASNSEVASCQIWQDHLSPHLQRNRQLQDTLMQREEELARLHEENSKLKEFLNSSYVKSLEDKQKKLMCAPQRQRKRRQQICYEELGVSRRTCRNLSQEFCSAEELASTPPLNSWVLETLGLQDEDTIAATESLPLGSPPVNPQRPALSPSPTTQRASASYVFPTADYSNSLPSTCDLSAIMDSSSTYSSSLSSSGVLSASQSSCSLSPEFKFHSGAGTPLQFPSTQVLDCSSGQIFSPAFDECPAPVACSTPQRSPQIQNLDSPRSAEGSVELVSPIRGKTELAFSMFLNPQSSVRTHSFPQGQAFVRKDLQGGWNFTWVPKQCAKSFC